MARPPQFGADKRMRPSLVPAADVEGDGPHFEALSGRPWLAIEPAALFRRRSWLKISYRLGLYDRPARPMLSFRRGSQEIGRSLLPGPVLGRGEGLAIAPPGTTAVWISPAAQKGRFSFVLETIEAIPVRDVFRLGWYGNRDRFFSALATFALGWRSEAELNFRWASQHAPLADWPGYRNRLAVAADLRGLERPRCDWARAPMVRLFARVGARASAEQIEGTIAALQAQSYRRWSLSVAGNANEVAAVTFKDSRIGGLDARAFGGAGDDLAGFIAFGDRPAPHALACFIEAMAREPSAVAAYCDEDIGAEPGFKPDWSPRLESARPYVGRLLLARHALARGRFPSGLAAVEEAEFAQNILRDLRRRDVLHIKRPLIATEPRARAALPPAPRAKTDPLPRVTVVMPTRDAADLLRRSVASLLQRTDYPALDLILVDNGSAAPALVALAEAERDPKVTRLDAPGAFNFSRLCNLGARAAKGEILIFLNNDVEITDAGWIKELAARASDPRAGAVGCLLLYPDGRIQHAGLVVGMGEGVGHCDAGRAATAAGWLGRNGAAHEISAVTGACLAVARAKFRAAGGFDEIHLPIEFNDVDLCLRLEELGFETLWTPFARLTISNRQVAARRLSGGSTPMRPSAPIF